jgi:curved DNA-binding protein CbpA
MDVEYIPSFEFEGNLQAIPLPVLIAHILDEKLSGMLHIKSEGNAHWIYFEDGFPAGVHAPLSQDFLGSVLMEMGILDDAGFNESLMIMAKTKQLQGEILLKTGKITEEQLEHALSLQLARKLAKTFSIKSGEYQFTEDEELPPPMEPIRVNPYSLILNGIKNCYSTDDLKRGLGPLVGKSCKLASGFDKWKDLFELPPDEMKEVSLLRDFRLPQEFVRRSNLGTTWAMMMLMALLSCGMLELGPTEEAVAFASVTVKPPAAKPEAPKPSPRPAPPPKPKPEPKPAPAATRPAAKKADASKVPRDLVKKIEAKFNRLQNADLFEVLEVSQKDDTERIKKSFLKLAKTFHPDLVANSGDQALIDQMDDIFARLNEAHEILTDPKRRMEYESALAEEGKPSGARPQEAKIHYEKAIVFYKKKDYYNAAESIRWAAELDPKNADYLAYQVWINYHKCEKNEEDTLRAKSDLYKIVRMNKNSFPAVRFLSIMYKKLGDMEDYEKCLLIANRLNPRDVEVNRELRLHQTRKKKEAKKGRFLGIKFRK